jgi:hypothetical protein
MLLSHAVLIALLAVLSVSAAVVTRHVGASCSCSSQCIVSASAVRLVMCHDAFI